MARTAGERRIVTVTVGRGHRRVQATAILADDGLVVTLLGGDRSHVGAVGIGIPRPSLRDGAQRSASSSVITITGHKEDALAKACAEDIARGLDQVAVVVAGMHVDAPAPGDIEALAANSALAVERLVERLKALPAERPSEGADPYAT
ncbi:MAG: hypothetical protein M1370_08850 [Bacteroidetes bacterium]|nr:hypothetical protein [Bacteroidota bacterium]MCL5026677.1 hypothetical protein [Chloroflexota bacterium]